MISKKHKCIFVHIPKTGGSSIESLIWGPPSERTEQNLWMGFVSKFHNKYQTGGLQHLLATQIRQEVPSEDFDEFFKFAFVRNPWDKAASQYTYMKQRKDLCQFLGMKPDAGLKTYLELIAKKTHVQWEHQHRFILDENGDRLIDYLGRFEAFDDHVGDVMQKLSLEAPVIPHINKGKRGPYQALFDAEAEEMLAAHYKTDIELFGYTF